MQNWQYRTISYWIQKLIRMPACCEGSRFRFTITDDMVRSDRFRLALDAIKSTYEVVVVDLGAIDGSLASARMLSFADRVFIAASAPDHGHELQSAANLLAHNTGARVDVLIVGDTSPDPRRNGDGHAA